jgi:tetratricopeptide (TPR) repeat protein
MMSATATPTMLPFRWTAGGGVKRLPFAQFLPLLRTGVAAAPQRVDLKLQLAKTLFHTDRIAELVEWLRPTIADDNADPELLYYLGRGALVNGNCELALSALESSARKEFVSAFGYLAEALHRLDRSEEALAAGLRGLEHSPSDFKALGAVVRLLLARGETQQLWDLCTDLRARGAWGAYVPSAMALAAATPEQASEIAELVSQQWVSQTHLDVPDHFNQALAEELLVHKSLSSLPSIKATIGAGMRIDQLELNGGPLALDLLVRIRAAIESYAAERQASAGHPMITNQPGCVALNSWAVAVHDDGHETWHIHPSGWISGVYYVQVPEIELTQDKSPGAIEFGPYPFDCQRESTAWQCCCVEPKAGMLLLFPSYYAHRTMPTNVREPRICVAFDAIPSSTPQPS